MKTLFLLMAFVVYASAQDAPKSQVSRQDRNIGPIHSLGDSDSAWVLQGKADLLEMRNTIQDSFQCRPIKRIPDKLFRIVFTVVFDSVTLQEAAQLEHDVKLDFPEASSIDLTVGENPNPPKVFRWPMFPVDSMPILPRWKIDSIGRLFVPHLKGDSVAAPPEIWLNKQTR